MRPLEVYEYPHCVCCGKLIAWTVPSIERCGHLVEFCSDRCVGVFDTYKLPKYGAAAAMNETTA